MSELDDDRLDELAALARTVPLTGTDLTELAAAVPELVAEVRRLREGINALVDSAHANGDPNVNTFPLLALLTVGGGDDD